MAEDVRPDGASAELRYWRLYADDEGISRLEEATLPFERAPVEGLEDPPFAASLSDVAGATFLRLAPRQVEDWHPTPSRGFLLVVQGISEITTGDGAVKRFHRGDIVLMDDTKGNGHITRAVGEEDHVALIVTASLPEL